MPGPLEPLDSGAPGGIAPSPDISSTTPLESPAPGPIETGETEQVSFRDVFSQRGFDVSQFPDDDQLMDYVAAQVQEARQVPQLRQLAQFGQQVSPFADEFYKWLDEKQKVQQAAAVPATPEPEPYWPAAPEWTPQWEQLLRVDQDQNSPTYGEIVAKSGARPDLVAKYHEYQDFQKNQMRLLLQDPYAAIEPKLTQREKAQEVRIREIVAEMQQQQQQQQAANSAVLANQDWLYQWGPNGQPLFNPQTGQPALSQEGTVFRDLLQYSDSIGVTDPNLAWDNAMKALPGTLAQMGLLRTQPGNGTPAGGQDTATQTPSPRQAANDRFVSQALAYQPNRGQTVLSAAEPNGSSQNPGLSFEQVAKQEAAKLGISF